MLNNKPQNEFVLSGSINRGIFRLAGPAIISVISIMLFEIIDLFWIGRLNSQAVAALGAASFIVWTVKTLANCVSAGINALVARGAGKGDQRMVQIWASQGLILTGLFSIFIMVSLYFLCAPLIRLLDLEPDVARMAYDYTLIICAGVFFFYEAFSLDTIFRSIGNTLVPMTIIIITLTLNALLDPLFIFGWFGFPKYGMPGGALASVISHFAGMLLFMIPLRKVGIHFTWNFKNFLRHSREIFRIGMPIGLLGAGFSFIYIVLAKNIAYFGTVPLAAISAAHRIEGLPYFIAFGFSMAVSTFVGQNLGNRNPARAEKAVNLSLSYACLFLFWSSLLFIFFGKSILGIFVPDQAVINEGYRYLFAISVFEIFLGLEVILEGAFTGAGDTKPPFYISIVLTTLRIPAAYFFSIMLELGVVAIWWVISISTFLKGGLMLFWFRKGNWKSKYKIK